VPPKYLLKVNVELVNCDGNGYPNYGTGTLRVQEELNVQAASFLEIAQILGRFHELNESLKEKHGAG